MPWEFRGYKTKGDCLNYPKVIATWHKTWSFDDKQRDSSRNKSLRESQRVTPRNHPYSGGAEPSITETETHEVNWSSLYSIPTLCLQRVLECHHSGSTYDTEGNLAFAVSACSQSRDLQKITPALRAASACSQQSSGISANHRFPTFEHQTTNNSERRLNRTRAVVAPPIVHDWNNKN